MSDENVFVLPTESYKRSLNMLQHYLSDSALYISKMSGMTLADSLAFVKGKLQAGGEFAFQDPRVSYLVREDNGDRQKAESTLSEYLTSAIKEDEIIAPTFTTYLPPKKVKSLLVGFLDFNVAARGRAKKEQFAAQQAGDIDLMQYKKEEQTGRKLSNNAMSGAHVSNSTPLANKTGHSTLTSNCRQTSGYGNANNEKFLCGNRHYWSPAIVRNNIISIINHTNYNLLGQAVAMFSLKLPTVEDVMDCIRYSAMMYWRTKSQYNDIEALVRKMSELERAAFVYTGDMYHLMKHNEKLVHDFISKLSLCVMEPHPDAEAAMKRMPEDHRHLAAVIYAEGMKGKDIKKIVGTETYGIVAATAENIGKVLQEYRVMIRALWVTENIPASVAVFPDSIRRCVVTSDTDSTIFTVQDWCIWHQGKLSFDPVSKGVAAAVVFLAAQTITHVLARMSANIGVEQTRLHQIAMKNEFFFDVFVPTQVAKHYFAWIFAQEGEVKAERETEIKGVHLKSSNVPKIVITKAKAMMLSIMDHVVKGEKISLQKILTEIGDVERTIMESVKKGSFDYFKRAQIKPPESYSKGEATPDYQQYLMWQHVFAPKYGETVKPPYVCCMVSVDLDSPTATKEWMERIEDKELVARIESWLTLTDRKNFGTNFKIPVQVINAQGIPKEILDAVDVRKIISNTTYVFYLILETLGVYMQNKNLTRLVSDTH